MQDPKQVLKKINKEPLWFIKEVLNRKLWSKQREIIESIQSHKRTTVKACHSVGKTMVSGQIILWFLYGHKPSIILSTAPTWRQVEKLIWKEVRSSYNRSTIPLGGFFAPKSPELQLVQDEWYAMGLSTNDANKFQGFHERNILIIVDEAAGVDDKIFEGIEGILASENSRLLLIGNPTSASGTFYESFKDSTYNKISISAFDSPNFRQTNVKEKDIKSGEWKSKVKQIILKKGQLISPNMVTPEWVADKYKRWKPGSPLYDSKVRGIFPTQGTDSLIPIHWVELAIDRWHNEKLRGKIISELGVDVAEYGSDMSVIAIKRNNRIEELIEFSNIGIMELTGHIIEQHRKYNSTAIKIDVIGIGTGVEGRLSEQHYPAVRVNVAESPGGSNEEELEEMKKFFLNKRAQLYWNLRDRLNPDMTLNPDPISLPPNEELVADLTTVKYKITSNGKIQVESKADLRKRIGRSPDYGDAIMLAVAPLHLLVSKISYEPNCR